MYERGAITRLMKHVDITTRDIQDVVDGRAGIEKGQEGRAILDHAEELVKLATSIRTLQYLQAKDATLTASARPAAAPASADRQPD